MARLEFQDIVFSRENGCIKLVFLRIFETSIDDASLGRLGSFSVNDHSIEIPGLSEKAAQNKFMPLLDRAFRELKSTLTGNPAVYVHQNSGIPLVGTLYFGIVDRGTSIIEVKPITGCNIDCPFCSVDAGRSSGRLVDFVVEDSYLVSETRKVIDHKQGAGGDAGKGAGKGAGEGAEVRMDVFVNTHGEPLLYANMVDLVRGLRAIRNVNTISIITNGTLLTKRLVDDLMSAGLTQLNVSLNAIDPVKAKELAGGRGYDVNHVIDMCCYAAGRLKLVIAPVWIRGVNDDEMPKLIGFAKGIGAEVGIQNYLVHKRGRKMSKQLGWEEFYAQLEAWEKQTGVDLKAKGHTLFKTRPLEKPFRKGDTVRAEIVCPGRMKGEMLAIAGGRAISIVRCLKKKGMVKLKVLRDKDNVFVGEEI
ncbi:radical SAM protein [Candidatus Woesearchaeota archaeon]|nr:radical SAM protein [Candidatus Woesearchaeota archaeon]